MKQEQLARAQQEEALEIPEAHEELSAESIHVLAASKETALDELKDRSLQETAAFENSFAASAQSLGATSEEISQVTSGIEQIEVQKEEVVEAARQQIETEARIEVANEVQARSLTETGAVDKKETTKPAKIMRAGQEKVHALYSSGQADSAFYIALSNLLLKAENGVSVWKGEGEVDAQKVEKILEYIKQTEQQIPDPEDDKVPPTLAEPVKIPDEFTPATKEREVRNPESLSARQASKEFFADERKKIAEEIRAVRAERKAQHDRLAAFQQSIDMANTSESFSALHAETDQKFDNFSLEQSAEADEASQRMSSGAKIDAQDAQDEHENMGQIIDNSEKLAALKAKVETLYVQADEKAKESIESIRKSVEQVSLRNNAFIVHTFLLSEDLRHNDNSNISDRASLEDDIDILLSLEPSISTSSVVPGSIQGLWNDYIGVVIGGGDIRGVATTDNGTVTGGIKYRTGIISSSQEIDEKVSDKKERSYNELVVNNPEVFGFFINVNVDESGRMIGFEPGTPYSKESKERFMGYINLSISKGLPPLIMTPDRRLFEFASLGEDGFITTGDEITPEQVAKGNAGLPNEKRKELGERIIDKNLFRKIEDLKEAKGIMSWLSGQEGAAELSREEYLAFARDEGGFHQFPKHLLSDKDFMMEAAQFNPDSAYRYAGENLRRDTDYIKHLLSLESPGDSRVYNQLPEDLRKKEDIVLLAIENGGLEGLDSSFMNSPVVWDKILDKKADQMNPNDSFQREIGQDQIYGAKLAMSSSDKGSATVWANLAEDPEFIGKMQEKYPNFKFEKYGGDLLVTKLA